ncbi:MAG: AAA family ATPase [Actinomycetia bacterium]|nr:AAA family ATPase [Actinomycetes bacterium]
MRLRRIEAASFGALSKRALGDLGDGLTVVLGPNEAGKSSFTALARYVLYGFPTAREKEPQFTPASGGRAGRLVFEEADGRWVIERTEGSHGGPLTVRTIAGAPRPGLHAEVTAGVSALAYKIVFGFGLDELSAIEAQRGSGDDIIAKLYAASAGLHTSPQDVRARLEKEAEEYFAPRGRSKRVNGLLDELHDIQVQIREVRDEGAAFAEDRERLSALETRLAAAQEARAGKRAALAVLAGSVSGYEERIATVEERERELTDLRRQLRAAEEAFARAVPDERVLAAAPGIDVLAGDASAFGQNLADLRAAQAERSQAERVLATALAETGLPAKRALALDAAPDLFAAIEEARDDLRRLEADRDVRAREAQRLGAVAAKAEAAVTPAFEPLGIAPGPEAGRALDALASELDAAESRAGGATSPRIEVPAIVMLVAGVASLVAGLLLGDSTAAFIGGVLALAGALFVVRGYLRGRALPHVQTAGSANGADTFRRRRALDAARSAWRAAEDARNAADAAASDATLSADTLMTRQALFAKRMTDAGLPAATTPAAAAQMITLVREARRASDDLQAKRDAVAALQSRVEAFSARVAALAEGVLGTSGEIEPDAVAGLVGRLKDALAAARDMDARRLQQADAVRDLTERIKAADERVSRGKAEARAILVERGLEDGGSLLALREHLALAEAESREADAAYDQIADERSQLQGALDRLAGEDRGAQLRLSEASVRERLGDAVDRYLVTATAARIVGRAQERYERERQPEVVKRAEEIFRTITGERYVGLSVPLGSNRLEVFDKHAAAKASTQLSRGTAEALYLALRLGLISQLDDVGPGLPVLMDDVLVNLDPERRRGAAAAVADLARERQIVLFTCHPDTAELLAKIAPDRSELTLDRC